MLFFINEMKQTHKQQDDLKWAFPRYAKYISDPKWCITRNFSVDELFSSVKKEENITDDYGWVWINVKCDGIFHSKQANENLMGLSPKSEGTK